MITGLAPVFLIILLGFGLKRFGFPGDAFWPAAERLTYFALFPVLLASNLATADLSGLDVGSMAAAMLAAVLLVSGLAILARGPIGEHLALSPAAYTSLFQGLIRPNTYVALAAAAALFGDAGVTLAAVGIATVVPVGNVLCVVVLSRALHPEQDEFLAWRRALVRVAQNPIILGVAAGIVLNLTGIGLPGVMRPLGEILGRGALPLALLAIGAGLDFAALRGRTPAILTAAAGKLFAMPLLTWLGCLALGVNGLTATLAILFNAMPPAPSAYVLARQMGGDGQLMAGIITAHTLLAFATLPILLALLGY